MIIIKDKREEIKKSIVKLFAIIIMIVVFCNIIGCKPTPSEKMILEHNPAEFQEMILIKNNDEPYEYSDYYSDEFLSKDGKVTITMDAEIITPEVSKLPVIKITPSPISDEMIMWAADNFIEGNEGTYSRLLMEREEAASLKLILESKLIDDKSLYEEYGSEANVKRVKDNLSCMISYLDRKYVNDTELEELKRLRIPTNFTLRPYEFYRSGDLNLIEKELNMSQSQLSERSEKGINLYLCSDVILSNGKYARLGIYNEYPYDITMNNGEYIFGTEKYRIHVVYSYIPLNIHQRFALDPRPFSFHSSFGSLDMFYPELSRTVEDSVNIALEELLDVGINNFYVESIDEEMGMEIKFRYYEITEKNGIKDLDFDEYCQSVDANCKFHKITFKPYYYNVPLLEANQAFYDGDVFYSPMEYESISIRMSEDGIAEFKWTNPTDISNVINDNVKIISLETAIQNAKQFMTLKYNLPTLSGIRPDMPDYDRINDLYNKASINIDTIKLGLAGIPANNSTDEYLLIPVWNFYGSYYIESDLEGYAFGATDSRNPFLSVNAIDGSIIHQVALVDYN